MNEKKVALLHNKKGISGLISALGISSTCIICMGFVSKGLAP